MSLATTTGCETCSATTRSLKIASVLVGVALVLHIVGFSTNYWFYEYDAGYRDKTHFGLWNYCRCPWTYFSSHYCAYSLCVPWDSPLIQSYYADYIKGTQAAECLGLIFLILAAILIMKQLFFSQRGAVRSWATGCIVLAALSIIVGVTLFGVNVSREYHPFFHFSFGMCFAAAILCIIAIPFLVSDRNSVLLNQQSTPQCTQTNTGYACSDSNTPWTVIYNGPQAVYVANPPFGQAYGSQHMSQSSQNGQAPIVSEQLLPY